MTKNDAKNTVFREIDPIMILTTMFHMGTLSIKAAGMVMPKDVMIDHIKLISTMQTAMATAMNATEKEVIEALKAANELEEVSEMLNVDGINESIIGES